MQDEIGRLPGVGETNVFGSEYAMRIWLDPNRLRSYSLMTGDVISAIQAQNTEVAAGQLGQQPMHPGQMLSRHVTAPSRLQKPQQFIYVTIPEESRGGKECCSK